MNKHDPKWLATTSWGKRMAKASLFKPALEHLQESDFKVYLYTTVVAGEKKTAIICTQDHFHFWLDAFKRRNDAILFCKYMDWEIT